MPRDWSEQERAITKATGSAFRVESAQPVGGGCINDAVSVEGGERRFFIKFNAASQLAMFEAEVDGLDAIRDSGTLRTPGAVACGSSGDRAWLILEHLELGPGGVDAGRRLGELLAAMHAAPGELFGWRRDNFIGANPQPNAPGEDWVGFLRNERLGFQLQLAARNGAPERLLDWGSELLQILPVFFANYRPRPALLHGDLWGGNWAALASGEPAVFDPAVYRGDREADIAMTELFGGFGRDFHAAYQHHLPLDPGYTTRRDLYKLYHLLNHFNLFGGGYARQAQATIERLLTEVV